jgi:hypothetical protein
MAAFLILFELADMIHSIPEYIVCRYEEIRRPGELLAQYIDPQVELMVGFPVLI